MPRLSDPGEHGKHRVPNADLTAFCPTTHAIVRKILDTAHQTHTSYGANPNLVATVIAMP